MTSDGPQNFHVFFQLELANHRPQSRDKGRRLRFGRFPFLELCFDAAYVTYSTQLQKFIEMTIGTTCSEGSTAPPAGTS